MSALKIKPEQVKLGYAIKLPSGWMKHPFLSSNMLIENQQQLHIIKNLGLDYVYFYPEKSKQITEDPTATNLSEQEEIEFNSKMSEAQAKMLNEKMRRIEQAKAHRRDIQKTEKAFNHSLSQVRDLMKQVSGRPLNAITEASQLISQLVDTIVNAESLILHLISSGNKDQETLYYHVLNVSIVSMMLARNLGFSAADIKIIGIGALFHDIGKLKIPSQILRKTTPLTAPEQNLLKMHTKYGTDLVGLADTFPLEAWPVIEQHHEYLDGTGYPKGLKNDQINKLAHIVAVVNEFDSLCHPADPTKARSPHHALAYLYRSMKGKLDDTTMRVMIKMMGVYPPGTVVMLSDQRIAMVMSVNSDSLLQPNVMIYEPEVPRLEAPVISLDSDALTISKVLTIASLPERVREYLNPRAQVSYYVQGKPG
ncbi:HDIG domain-containing protein [Arsukibacterium tuosuense]|uniref:HDIG domain-containing protein n=1 Tax=Arsukibacterium tuosuense TaxID=1323745 RepID=A0A285IT34_9GAMM|nr:HD-GYP domain-containing protein [Arsukibacterium tuosuense]SNY51179.1 HDIG domain-containing protein [Arsukibacterium tuosuense]